MKRVCVALILLFVASPAHADIAGRASVIDGDTLELRGERIRLHGIDAPESDQSCLHDGRRWPCGRRSANALADRIGERIVRCEGDDRDRYGRLIAICYVGGDDLNAWLVRRGWALAYRRYSTDYVPAEERAKAGGLGVWRGDFVPPWDWRRGERIGARGSGSGSEAGDRDCGHFDTHAEAQRFFERHQPGDPHRLDGDGDGVACEGLR